MCFAASHEFGHKSRMSDYRGRVKKGSLHVNKGDEAQKKKTSRGSKATRRRVLLSTEEDHGTVDGHEQNMI